MSEGEEIEGEQTPNYIRKRFIPCRCDSARGLCRCYEDDGGVSHGGCDVEAYEWIDGGTYPRRAGADVRDVDPVAARHRLSPPRS